MFTKAVFLDRDGVINRERGDYTYTLNDFEILPGVKRALEILKREEYLTIIITNQAGIAKGIYDEEQMHTCHQFMIESLPALIDDIYFSPYHEKYSLSLSRKPDSLMFERAIAKYKVDTTKSWMVGDKERDLIPAKKMGLQTIIVGPSSSDYADFAEVDLLDSVKNVIVSTQE